MKRFVQILLCSLFLMTLCCGFGFSAITSVSLGWAQEVVGFVEDYNSLLITIDESVLPFDLASPTVMENANPNIVRGLRIGTINMTSNAETFIVSISHDRLRPEGATGPLGNVPSIDYRLDIFYGSGATDFISIRAADTNKVITEKVLGGSPPYAIVSKSLYVSLSPDTSGGLEKQIEDLPIGKYISDITFNMVAE